MNERKNLPSLGVKTWPEYLIGMSNKDVKKPRHNN